MKLRSRPGVYNDELAGYFGIDVFVMGAMLTVRFEVSTTEMSNKT